MRTLMNRRPTLRGRYDKSVFSPMQWGVLAVIGYLLVLGLQVDVLRHATFRIEFLNHEVAHVVPQTPPAHASAGSDNVQIITVAPDDWPAPPIQTAWTPRKDQRSPVISE